MEKFRKVLIIIGIVCALIVVSYIGMFVLRFAMGMLVFLIFLCGGFVGFGIGRLFPKKSNKENQ
jgi:hypothetical protein